MKYSDLKPGMKIRAVAAWSDCWAAGDEFDVYERDGVMSINCHDGEFGPHHGLDGTATEDGDLPEFEPA